MLRERNKSNMPPPNVKTFRNSRYIRRGKEKKSRTTLEYKCLITVLGTSFLKRWNIDVKKRSKDPEFASFLWHKCEANDLCCKQIHYIAPFMSRWYRILHRQTKNNIQHASYSTYNNLVIAKHNEHWGIFTLQEKQYYQLILQQDE